MKHTHAHTCMVRHFLVLEGLPFIRTLARSLDSSHEDPRARLIGFPGMLGSQDLDASFCLIDVVTAINCCESNVLLKAGIGSDSSPLFLRIWGDRGGEKTHSGEFLLLEKNSPPWRPC